MTSKGARIRSFQGRVETVLLTLALLTLVAMSAVPALAQTQGTLAQSEANVRATKPDPSGTVPKRDDSTVYNGPYMVIEDGALVYGGDSVYRCKDLVTLGAPAKPDSKVLTFKGRPLEPLTREAVELCAKAGFRPEGAVLSVPTSLGTPDTDKRGTLPATGGPTLPTVVTGAAALAAIGTLLVLNTGKLLFAGFRRSGRRKDRGETRGGIWDQLVA